MAQAERATVYQISRLKFHSPSAVRPHFERSIILSPCKATILWKIFPKCDSNKVEEIEFLLQTYLFFW